LSEDVIDLMPRQRPATHQPGDQLTAPTVMIADRELLVSWIVTEAVACCSRICLAGHATTASDLLRLGDESSVVVVDPFSLDLTAKTDVMPWRFADNAWHGAQPSLACLAETRLVEPNSG
jgi:hypothetical protein